MFHHHQDIKLSMKTILLFWQLHIVHQHDCDSDGGDGLHHNDCFIHPVSAPTNVRDASHSRISSLECNNILLRNTQSHAIFGRIITSDKYSDMDCSGNAISSIFDRYTICKVNGSKCYFDSSSVMSDSDKSKVYNFVSSLSINTVLNPLPQDALEKIAMASTFEQLMTYFVWLLNHIYAGFESQSAFEKLNRCIDNLIHNEQHSENNIYDCIKKTGIELKATYRFQQYMFPACIALMDGTHRHLLVLVNDYLYGEVQFVVGENSHGYQINSNGMPKDQTDNHTNDVNYSFYTLDEQTKFMDLTINEILTISRRQNHIQQNSICEESCHRVIGICVSLSNALDPGFASMANNIRKYLQMTPSELKNSNRKKQSAYNVWRHQKVELRKLIAERFYPDSTVCCSYTQGNTYIEKFCKRRLDEVFTYNAPQQLNTQYYIFLLLDNIYAPSEIIRFIKLLQESYIYRHSSTSKLHSIQHTEIWNSKHIFQDIIDFIFLTVTLMKCVNVQNHCFQKFSLEISTIGIDATFRQKVTHCCQQYALFIVMKIIQDIGLYPEIANSSWAVNGDSFHDYNVFALIIALLQCNERDLTNHTPTCYYIDLVIYDFIAFIIAASSHDDDNQMEDSKFPLTFLEFEGNPCSENVILFFDLMTTDSFVDFTTNFYSSVGSVPTKRRKLNTKNLVAKMNDSGSNEDASEATEGSVSSNETASAAVDGSHSSANSGSNAEESGVTVGSASTNAPDNAAADVSNSTTNILRSHSDHTKEHQISCTETQLPKGGSISTERECLHMHPEHYKENQSTSGNTRLPEHCITDTTYNLSTAVGNSSKSACSLSSDDQSFIKEFMETGKSGISSNDVESVVRALRSYESRRKGC